MQKFELLQRHLHVFAANTHDVLVGIEAHITHFENRTIDLGRRRTALGRYTAHHRAHAGHQLAHSIRLGDVVVGTHLEPDDGVDLGSLGRHHDDRHLRALTQLTAHVDTRHLGQHHVEQHDIGLHQIEAVERLQAVAGHLDPESFTLQPHGERVDETFLVLDEQNRLRGHDVVSLPVSPRPAGPSTRDRPQPESST